MHSKPCNGSRMVRVYVALANGQRFGAYVSPPAFLTECAAIARAVNACGMLATFGRDPSATWTVGGFQ